MRLRRASAASACAAALGLCGCANLPFGAAGAGSVPSTPGPDTSAAAPAGTPTGRAATATDSALPSKETTVASERAVYQLEVVAPSALRPLLTNYLDLSRFQNAPETEGITAAELDRLIAAAPAQARSLLETEGYFNAEVEVARVQSNATPADTSGAAPSGMAGSAVPLLRIVVTPGPRAMVSELTLEATGELLAAVQARNPQAVAELATLRRQWPLQPGQPFRQPAWNDAKNTTLARLRAEGYPAATWSRTAAQVDALTHSVRLTAVADSGPLFRLGAIRVEGLQRYDEASVKRLATFGPGTVYSEKTLLDYQERLQKAGLFEGASVEVDPNPATADAAPVLVRVKEQTLQQATFGVGYSANTGPRLTLEHVHRQVFGSRWTAKNKFEIGPELKTWQGELTSYPLEGNYRNLVAGSAERLRSSEELRTSWSARLGRTQDTQRIERLYYAELSHARLDTVTGTNNSNALSGNYHWVFRDVDSVLLPTSGHTLSAQAALGYARGEQSLVGQVGSTDTSGPFARTYGRYTLYLPLGSSWYATARVEAGQVLSKDAVGVPDTLLFRAGGDESVRGYAYRTLGPTVNGALGSGRVLLTGSAEVARPISAARPEFWWAAFIDAGNAASRWGELHPALGYGVGFRWRSPVGPLRVDLAYGQEVHAVRLHLSVGIAF